MVPMVITFDASTDGQRFRRCETLQAFQSDNNFIALVMTTIGQHQGSLYYANENPLLYLLRHILIALMLSVFWPHGMITNEKSVSNHWSTMGSDRASYNNHSRCPTLSKEK